MTVTSGHTYRSDRNLMMMFISTTTARDFRALAGTTEICFFRETGGGEDFRAPQMNIASSSSSSIYSQPIRLSAIKSSSRYQTRKPSAKEPRCLRRVDFRSSLACANSLRAHRPGELWQHSSHTQAFSPPICEHARAGTG